MSENPKPWEFPTIDSAESHLRAPNFSPFILNNLINGSFSPCPAEATYIDSYNPKTGQLFARIHDTSAEEVNKAVEAADRAFTAWSTTPPSRRSKYLLRIAELIEERRELFAVWESVDQGKTLVRARVEVDRAVSNFRYTLPYQLILIKTNEVRYFATYILHQSTSARWTDDNVLTYEHRSPIGVFGLISPWNMPLYLLTWKIAPCLAFGCTAVAKPSEVTSLSAYLLAKVFQDADLPPGVVNIVFGTGKTTGSSLVKHPKVRGVSFTGGTATGIQIRKDTVEDIGKHVSLELGGKNPTLVFDDVDLNKAVPMAAKAAFENQGEICLCGSRIYVQRKIWKEFIDRFVDYVKQNYILPQNVGAVASLEHYKKIRYFLDLADRSGGNFYLGSVPPEQPEAGYWIEPAILTVPDESPLLKEEIFGPVVTLTPFDTEEEAVRLANDSRYGLSSVLLTENGGRIRRVGERIDAGLVWVNCWLVRELGTPFGGMKASGTGREGGDYSRDVFTNVRTLHIPQ
ncbi:aldehyde dehydrogenase AldH12 [Aspergillus sclerotialis]|uniref:Aldehyde dehydrogenase AldH12 n=1 Tax=Aspergillus sclerotialis TaxID=2070753 RepID=A0A3A2ZGM2_9EURO|nr:aldehyde dehydrogenase AldH12 [Aspergillus sclerotialis]